MFNLHHRAIGSSPVNLVQLVQLRGWRAITLFGLAFCVGVRNHVGVIANHALQTPGRKIPADMRKVVVVVPLYIPEISDPTKIRDGFARFLKQFASAQQCMIFLSDSGPNDIESQVADALTHAKARVSEQNNGFAPEVTYFRERTETKPLSRGEAMNRAVDRARAVLNSSESAATNSSDNDFAILCLHIDCELPDAALQSLRDAMNKGIRAGGFVKEYRDKRPWSPLHWTEYYLNEVRTRRQRQLVGTNAIFFDDRLQREHPYQGDFLEDVEMSDWLRKRLHTCEFQVLDSPVKVSAKKYQKRGVLASIATNASVMILYRLFGVGANKLGKYLYHRKFKTGLLFWPELMIANLQAVFKAA